MKDPRDSLYRRSAMPRQEGPSIVVVLILLNVGVFVLRQLFVIDPQNIAGAISVNALQQGEWWTVVSHAFIHGDWFHLLMNMAVLFLAGGRVLADTGTRHFLYIYLVSVWVAAAATLLLHSHQPLIGASAGVAGVFGAYAALHPERSVTAWIGAWMPRLRVRSLFFGLVGAEIGLEVFAMLTESTYRIPMVHDVAHMAHAAGMLTGWLYARHLAPVLDNFYHREEFFPQGLRRRHRETESAPVPARAATLRRVNDALPEPVFSESPPPPLTNDEFLRQAVDPVLDKLYASGMGSLTEAERRILDEAANRFSKGRG
jgi:membrane associated rhomboid family serine protease